MYINILFLLLLLYLITILKFKLEKFSSNIFLTNSYYINLDKHNDRQKFMEKQFKDNNLDCSRFVGYDKKLLDNKKLDELRKNNIIDINYHPNKSKLGSIGCLLAHTNLYKKIKNDYTSGHFLILEDDCKILPNFNEKLQKYIKTLPPDWDMAWLGYNNIKGIKINEDWYKPKQGFFSDYNSQHHCYLLNYKGIDKVLDILFPINKSFINKDMIFRKNFDKFNAYFLKERLSIQDLKKFPISERTGRKNG
uniref:Glycosyl transferase family 25 domain-containing protein n=1 Tax=viral metagenome TaxID=1070528 RepID=A0A6C0J8I2_9ZZZZ